jgi:hypothetical protein
MNVKNNSSLVPHVSIPAVAGVDLTKIIKWKSLFG